MPDLWGTHHREQVLHSMPTPPTGSNHQRTQDAKEEPQARRALIAKHPICQCTGWCGQHSGMQAGEHGT